MTFADDPKLREQLRLKFPPEQVGHMPKAGMMLDFVGHAAVTDRMNRYAPDWSYTIDEMFTHGGACWLRITMTVGEVSRPEYGDGKDPKEAIGNAIRRAAMRFGVAIDLWSREELETSPGPDRPDAGTVTTTSSVDHQGGVPGGTTSAGLGEDPTEAASEERRQPPKGEGAGRPGEAPAPVTHDHQWVPSPKLKSFEVCAVDGCLETRRIKRSA